ncbi:ABC transporter permease [Anditalea andensis]|uniref:ABC transporter permease n=1 Tax=Anditalea andensis TaxID=1048983 RepID=A0A074KVS3_9BACT|nr:ABC transporter permease [Anditalea andensis]KEO71683.1 ABC transporter permease [Anditalea andensis]
MHGNILKIAFRNFWKSKSISLINILGFSMGIAICMVISLFLVNELSYDHHHERADRIYRTNTTLWYGGNHLNMVYAPAPLAETLKTEFPEVEAAVHFRNQGAFLVKREEENIKEGKVIFAGKDFFRIFTVPILEGAAKGALDQPRTMAVSRQIAEKFFPGEEAVGKQLILNNHVAYQITAVYENMPTTSHFDFNMILAAEGLSEAKSDFWLANNFQTYLLLQPGADPAALQSKLRGLVDKHISPAFSQIIGEETTLDKFEAAGNKLEYTLQPLLDIHLQSDLMGEFEPNFSITYIYMFGAIALFILLLACINFMNLSTAKSATRAKEVGVRKVMGSSRKDLIGQFMLETILMSLVSFAVATVLASLLLPFFNEISGRTLTVPFTSPIFYMVVLSGVVLVGIVAGIYPSFFLSGFSPAKVLKGNVALGMKSGTIRSSLVVFQFAVSIILIFATLVVFNQLNFIQNKNLGFNKDQVIMIEDIYTLGDQVHSFKNELVQSDLIEQGTLSSFLPVWGTSRSDNPWWVEGKDPQLPENMVSSQNWSVDVDYIETLNMNILEGRNFSLDFPSDTNSVILNESAVRHFGFQGDPIGQRVATFDGDEAGFDKDNLLYKTVIGVVENFHFESLKENIGPVMIYLQLKPQGYASFRFQAQSTGEVVELIETKWKAMAPGQPFNYSFLDERFDRMYEAETRIGKVFLVFTCFAIFIACLGLFALTAFTAEQRRKEIGIRKALGADTISIVYLLSKEYTRLVVISFVIGAPLAWIGMGKWLESYQYRTEMGWEVFTFSVGLVILVAWAVMGYQSIRAALANPIKSLRSE